MADALVQLNASWRVADDPPQWTIEQRKGSGWRARKFIRDCDHLLRRIGELCGVVASGVFRRSTERTIMCLLMRS